MRWFWRWLELRACHNTTAEVTIVDGQVQIAIIHKCNGGQMGHVRYGPERARYFASYVEVVSRTLDAEEPA